MYEINFNGIEEIIDGSRFVENEETNQSIKKSLKAIAGELCKYTRSVNQSIAEGARWQEDNERVKDIYTVLLPVGREAEYEAVGLYKMAEPEPRRVFLDCEYDRIRETVGDLAEKKVYKGRYIKDGKAASFEYFLNFDKSFLKAQEILFDYAEHYGVKNPIILSPYSRKSFWLKFDESLIGDGIELDFCFDDNHIPAISGKEYCLYWNIKQSAANDKTYAAKEPYGDIIKYVFTFGKTKKGNTILPLPLNNQTRIYEIRFADSGVEIVINRDIEDFLIFEYFDLDLDSAVVKQSKKRLFGNKVIDGAYKKRRILSEGDIERAIGCFRAWQDVRCERSNGQGNCIIRYAKKYCTDRRDKVLFNTIRREYISFSKADKKFLTDYANYILEYLEYYFPEIEWVGVE